MTGIRDEQNKNVYSSYFIICFISVFKGCCVLYISRPFSQEGAFKLVCT